MKIAINDVSREVRGNGIDVRSRVLAVVRASDSVYELSVVSFLEATSRSADQTTQSNWDALV